MASLGHVSAIELAADLVDQAELNAKLTADVNAIKADATKTNKEVTAIKSDYVTSKNVGIKFRSSLPIHHSETSKTDYNTLTFGDHTVWDFATGETNAPPVPEPMWMFVEMIRTFPYSPEGTLIDNAIQRAWGYDKGFLAVRTRYRNKWSAWVVTDVREVPSPVLPKITE